MTRYLTGAGGKLPAPLDMIFLNVESAMCFMLESRWPSDDHSFLWRVTDRLDAVPVRIDDKGRVVVGMILRAHARAAIVVTSRAECRAVKGTDRHAVGSAEEQCIPRRGDTPVSRVIVNSTPNCPAIAP